MAGGTEIMHADLLVAGSGYVGLSLVRQDHANLLGRTVILALDTRGRLAGSNVVII